MNFEGSSPDILITVHYKSTAWATVMTRAAVAAFATWATVATGCTRGAFTFHIPFRLGKQRTHRQTVLACLFIDFNEFDLNFIALFQA